MSFFAKFLIFILIKNILCLLFVRREKQALSYSEYVWVKIEQNSHFAKSNYRKEVIKYVSLITIDQVEKWEFNWVVKNK